jgi:hypothetical protein
VLFFLEDHHRTNFTFLINNSYNNLLYGTLLMASELFNAVSGFSVGIPPIAVIDETGNIVTNVLTPTGNVAANVIYAGSYRYANGQPLVSPAAGANTQVQYNLDGELGASAGLTFDSSSSTITVYNTNTLFNTNTSSLVVTEEANLGNVSNVTIDGGSANYILTTDGFGNLEWSPTTAVAAAGANTQVQFNTDGQFDAAAALTFDTTSNTLAVTGNLDVVTFKINVGEYDFYTSMVYSATTASTVPNQVLFSIPASTVSALEFTIISTDLVANRRQTTKISAVILGDTVVFNEYAGLIINGGVGSCSVIYDPAIPPSVQLVVDPDSDNLTRYNMLIVKFAS